MRMDMVAKVVDKMELPNDVFLKEVRTLIAEGHHVTLLVRGVSMRPFLEDRRDKIVLTKPHTPLVGDPVLAEIAPGKYVYHRIIAIEGDKVILKGDGNVQGTETCRLCNVVASTQAFIRRGKSYSPQGRVWRWYSMWWPQWPLARRVLLKIYRILRCYQ